MKTIFGIACDGLGLASDGGRFWATPSGRVRAVQERRVPVNIEHNPHDVVGEVIHLDRRNGSLWLVAQVHDRVRASVEVVVGDNVVEVSHPLYWSLERRGGEDYGFVIDAVALTTKPARVAPRPIVMLEGALDHRGAADRWSLDGFHRELLVRAANSHLDRRQTREPLVVHGEHPGQRHALELRANERVELRAATAVDVNRTRRELDVVIAPAESPTTIHERGQSYIETFAHGCFAGVEVEPEKVKVNMHHQRERTVGKAVALDPWAEEGLVGTLKLAKVADADEWHGSHRRVRRAHLDHIALTPDPAYLDAHVLAARGAMGL